MNNAQKAQAFLDTSINGTGGLILHAYESIEIITALLAERAALIAEFDLLKITEYEISVQPWMESAYELSEVRAILDKYRSTK